MGAWKRGQILMAGVMLSLLGFATARADVRPDDPETLKKTRSLGELIAANPTRPIHIVYVHGMRANGPGASDQFRKGMCQHVSGLCPTGWVPTRETRPLPLGAMPAATYLDHPIWRNELEWKASTPFVYRYVYPRVQGEPVIVDEVNWWPLLFPAKCRFIVYPEMDLSGVDKEHIKLCAKVEPPYYPWLSSAERDEALRHSPLSAGAAWANALGKQQIMNWGMADAALALGPLRSYFRRALNLAFDYASRYDAKDVDEQEFVVISESLGSFVVLDAFGDLFKDSAAAARVGERTADIYFFANQFALLQLGRIDGIPAAEEGAYLGAPIAPSSPVNLLFRWATSGAPSVEGGKLGAVPTLKQVIAFSDPNDLLTYPVPKLKDNNDNDVAYVVNVYDRNEWSFLGLFANPLKAHTGHAGNQGVLKLMFRR